ncbi:MAG: hypothetical protein AB7Q17_07045 [Phycisphaerae bacterium]
MRADERSPNHERLTDRLRRRARDARDAAGELIVDLRAEPWAPLRSPVVRLALFAIAAVIIVVVARSCLPAIGSGSEPRGETATIVATIHVACTNPDCHASYVAHPNIDFKAWPMVCEKCATPGVYRAKLCPTCRSWFATAPGANDACPACAARNAATQAATQPARPRTGDDAEDGW